MGLGTVTPATLTPGALIVGAGTFRNPAPGMDHGNAVESKLEG